jgi:hypothetical protein
MRKALYDRSTGWAVTYRSLVQSATLDVRARSDEVNEIYADFDLLISWLTAFHYLSPITDEGFLQTFVERLERSGYSLQVVSGVRFHSCNCERFIHYGLCKHCVALGISHKLITAIPAHLDPASRRRGGGRRGRLPKAKRGGAFAREDLDEDEGDGLAG